MKKNELVKKSRKLLSAILTGTVLITSVVPESLIWAADVEMQEFEDGEDNEDVIFEAAEEPAEEPETEDVEESGEVEIQDLSESQDEDDTEDAVEVEEDFTDGVALFSSGSEMAVGTAAANTISPGEDVTITSGGTYTVQGGTYTNSISINTAEEVTLEIAGEITVERDPFITVKNACKELKIMNNQNYKVTMKRITLLDNKNATVTFEGGIYEGRSKGQSGSYNIICNDGIINLKNVKIKVTDVVPAKKERVRIVDNFDGTLNIQDGTTLDNGGARDSVVEGGTVNMYGGTITSSEGTGFGILDPDVAKIVGGKISNFKTGPGIMYSIDQKGPLTIGNVTFENNDSDIALASGSEKKLIIQDDFKGTASVYQIYWCGYPYIITMPGTSPDMRTRITFRDQDGNPHSVNYDTTEKYLYASDHVHSWSYSTSANKIIATCTAKTDCEFNSGKLNLTLAAADAYYSGNTYTGAIVTNDITCQTGDEASIVYCLKDGTKTNSSNSGAASEGAAPVNSGQYTVKVTFGGQTISADFEIKKAKIDSTVTMDNWTYGQKANTPSITVKSGESDITDSYDASGFTCTYYTDGSCTDMTTAADGAATNGGVPKNAGTYYVKAVVPENGNYAGAEAETSFKIAPLPADLTWSKTDLIYTGSEQSVSATVANALEGDSFAIAYEGNTQTKAGNSYTATVTDLGNDNYTLTGATRVSQNWSISYLQTLAAAQVFGTKGNNDWYISPVKLVPDSGYQISTDKTDWKDSLGDYTDQGEQSAEYYLKETATGAVTDKKTVTFKIDTGMPSGSIRIGENTFDSSLKDITYGYWFKDNVSVDITGADSASGIASVEYQAVSAEESYDANGTWLPWNAEEKLSLTESGRYVVYARVTDKAGNQTIINSDGVVVFKDSVVVDSSIDYTRTTKASVDAKVTLNGNTVASVRNGETTLTEGKDYTVSEDRITFSGEYLDTLEAGTYKLTVAYHPQGVTEYKGGDKPADSQIAVNVSRQTANVKITGTLDKEYDGQPADLAYTTNSNVNIKVEYNVNGTWQTEAPIHAGTYEVRVSVSENGDFTAASDTKAYTIRQREVVVSGITAKGKVYDGTADAELDYSKAVFAGAVKGDSLTVSAEGTFADSNAAKEKTVTITKPVLGGGSAGDYILADNGQQTSTTADISPKEITVKITPNGGIYEGTITPATAVLDGLVGEDDPEIILTYAGKANDGTEVNGTEVPSLAGTYIVTATITDSNYSLKEDGSSAEFTIKRADPQLSVSAVKDKKYGEEAFKLEVSNKGDGVKSYVSSDDKVVTVDNNGVVTIIGTGTATLTVSLAESANYTADQKEVTVAVGKIEHSLVVDKISYRVTYGDPAFKITAKAGDKESGIQFASDNKEVATVSKDGTVNIGNTGTAKITVSMDESQNYLAVSREVTVTVVPKEISAKIAPNGGIYGEIIVPAVAALEGLVGEDDPEITLTYTGRANDGTEVNGTKVPSLAGIYTVTATIKDKNYSLKTEGASAAFIVAKAYLALSVSAVKDKKYGEEAFKLEVSNKGNGVKSYASSDDKVVTVDKNGVVTIVGAGTATLTVSLAETANYTADQKEVTVTVVPKEITVKITPNGGTYEGTITPATAVLNGLVGEDDPEIILTYAGKANDGTEVNGTEVPSLAGTYTVTATIKDKNYSLKPEGSSAEFVVAKADPALSVSEVTDKDYGEETFRLNVSNKGDGLKTYASSDDKVVAVDENGMVTIAGTGTATLTVFLAETANYTAAQKEVTITVRKLGHSLVVDKLSYKVTYGDPAFKITAKAKDTESAIRFASDNKEVATVSEDGTVTIRNAGTAKITVSMDESQNYLAVSREVIITVAPKNITVTADNKNKIAGKADPVLTYTAKGLVGEDTLSGITVKRKAGEKVGIYPITVSQASGSNPNYRITFRKGIFTIEQADQSKLSGKDVYRLKLPVFFAAGKAQKNSIVVSWRKYPGAAGYDVFWCYCDGSINYKKAGTVKNGKLSMTHKNLKSNREYKYFVAAYKMVKGRKIYIAKSNEVHVAMKKARTTNAFSIKVNRTTVILKPGKTFRLKCQLTSENRKKELLSHPSSYRYYTTNSKIATVSQNGVIRAKAKGSCSIYILASNGVYKRVTVKVK